MKGQLAKLLGLLAPYKRAFLLATFLLLIGTAIGLVYPYVGKEAIDQGFVHQSDTFDQIILVLLCVVGLHGAVIWGRHYLMSWLGERVVADMRSRVAHKLFRFSPTWFANKRTGELVGRLAADVTVLENAVGSEFSMALRYALQLVGAVTMLFWLNAKLTIWALLLLPPLVVFGVWTGMLLHRRSKAVQDRLADASGDVQEALSAVETVQVYGQEKRIAENYRNRVEDAFDAKMRLVKVRASLFSGVSVVAYIGIAVLLWRGAKEIQADRLTPGGLAAFLLYALMVAEGLATLSSLWGSLNKALGATERLFDILESPVLLRDGKKALPPGRSLKFEAVSFHYPSRPDSKALNQFSFHLEAGQHVALVGPSGSGKSTIAKLICRFYDPNSGRITLGETPLDELKLDDYRKTIAIVAQEPVLFSGTIRENILFSAPDADDDTLHAAAEAAFVSEFVENLPEQYDTRVGERGQQLSVGQKQRVAIARAIVADPELLILDEATSNLDQQSEQVVLRALGNLSQNRTTITIAHRLSTIRNVPTIIVINRGNIAESGNHEELMARQGLYHNLYSIQEGPTHDF